MGYTEYGIINPYYGVTPTCDNKILKVASFKGDGHMEVKSQTLRRDSSFSFTFKTEQENGLLALSSFLGKSSGDLADFYSVSLTQGHVSVIIGTRGNSRGGHVSRYVSEEVLNDAKFHTLFVIKRDRRVTIYIDDMESGSIILDSSSEIIAPKSGGLFLGGVPSVISSDIRKNKLADSVDNLVGVIRDVIFIDDVTVRAVALNEPVSFFNVAIGRDRYH